MPGGIRGAGSGVGSDQRSAKLRADIERHAAAVEGLASLKKMHALVPDVNLDLMTQGHGLVPGGYRVPDALMTIITGAITDAERRDKGRRAKLKAAKAHLVEVEAELGTFNETR